ncbi:hypothetical protein FGO68_gene12004 [Halteria grandinella]|uniref:CRC domain-containing protein n=1 Tax=Halteria grandinella TaxID=5974 RepID=A0A8J8NT18_HALGN|nr:hypothetical protein FGO68_gene12004 [Halteria grandinella]
MLSQHATTASSTREEFKQTQVKCTCKKSQCLKLYCDCFTSGLVCGPECGCLGCCNTEANTDSLVQQARQMILQKNPQAFSSKVAQQQTHRSGCKCKRSGCQKKYCECYHLGVPCGHLCKCTLCQNGKPCLGADGEQKLVGSKRIKADIIFKVDDKAYPEQRPPSC